MECAMELLQLQYFVKVAKLGSITQAAKQLYVSQPALSATIVRLERDISVTLFHRSANKIVLTPAGEEFLKYAEMALDALETGVAVAKQVGCSEKKDIHIVSALGVMRYAIETYSKLTPRVNMTLGLLNNRSIIKSLAGGKADFGVSLGALNDEKLVNELVMQGPVFVAVGVDNPKYMGVDRVSIKDLAHEKLFCSRLAETEYLTRKMFTARSLSCELMPLDEKDVLFAAAEKNLGLVVCLPMMYDQISGHTKNDRTIRFMLIDDVTECWAVYLVRRKGITFDPLVQDLYDVTRQHFQMNHEYLQKLMKKIENCV